MTLTAPSRPITYPARPIDGGSLDKARPKRGEWHYEIKFNGWRAMVHAPTGTMFNRHGTRLTIADKFKTALDILRDASPFEWLDCEVMERRHDVGRGSLIVLDFIPPITRYVYAERRLLLHEKMAKTQIALLHDFEAAPPPTNNVILASNIYYDDAKKIHQRPKAAWVRLQNLNREWKVDFFEGLVAKQAMSTYPVQRVSADQKCTSWMKHRWKF